MPAINDIEDIATFLDGQHSNLEVQCVDDAMGYVDVEAKVNGPTIKELAERGWGVSCIYPGAASRENALSTRIWFSELGTEEREVTTTETVVTLE